MRPKSMSVFALFAIVSGALVLGWLLGRAWAAPGGQADALGGIWLNQVAALVSEDGGVRSSEEVAWVVRGNAIAMAPVVAAKFDDIRDPTLREQIPRYAAMVSSDASAFEGGIGADGESIRTALDLLASSGPRD